MPGVSPHHSGLQDARSLDTPGGRSLLSPRLFVSILAAALLTLCLGAGVASAIVLPTGFYTENVAPSAAFDTPVQVVFMPDTTAGIKRMLVVEKRGVDAGAH